MANMGEQMMTKEELIEWIDKPPSNSDLDKINKIVRIQSAWEMLKHALICKFNETQNTIYLDILTDIMQPLEEKREIKYE